jgi:hypothetical protein
MTHSKRRKETLSNHSNNPNSLKTQTEEATSPVQQVELKMLQNKPKLKTKQLTQQFQSNQSIPTFLMANLKWAPP